MYVRGDMQYSFKLTKSKTKVTKSDKARKVQILKKEWLYNIQTQQN